MQKCLTDNQKWILAATANSLSGSESKTLEAGVKFDEVLAIANEHSITPLIVKAMTELAKIDAGDNLEDYGKHIKQLEYSKMVRSLQVIYLTKKLCDAFNRAGIHYVILKGLTVAKYYDNPEKRKSGDVDVMLYDEKQMDVAKAAIISLGAHIEEEQNSQHHIGFRYEKTQIEIELHTMICEPFDNKKIDSYMENMLLRYYEHTEITEVFGIKVPALGGAYMPFELLVHMLKHFLLAGFGLKNLCDWVVFWNSAPLNRDEQKEYLEIVEGCGIKVFSDIVTLACIRYLGMDKDKVEFMGINESSLQGTVDDFMLDIFDATEYGHSSKSRMVSLRNDSIFDYLREFHHQMKHNNPKTGKVVVLWPYLWIKTLVVFIYNNKKLRKVNTLEVYKNAGKRGKLTKQLQLFR